MPNIKSVMKNDVKSKKQNAKNKAEKSAMKTAIRRFDEALAGDDKEKQQQAYLNAVKVVDQTASNGVIHKNAANHKKAQLAKKQAKAQ